MSKSGRNKMKPYCLNAGVEPNYYPWLDPNKHDAQRDFKIETRSKNKAARQRFKNDIQKELSELNEEDGK